MKVIAHRGSSGERPENTLPAYRLAIAQRADMIEIDLHRTRDGAIPVTHDASLAHLGGRGEIADATLAEVRALDAGGGERVPLLPEVLDEFGARIPFNLELKVGARGAYAGLVAATLAEVERRDLLAQTLFSSFYDDVLAELRAQSPAARIALLISRGSAANWTARARGLRAEALNPELAQATPELVRAAHAEGLALYVFTVDAEPQMRRMLELGADGLFTNHPARLRALLESAPLR
ncbi:MAG TPA: glycerophosphodiester phosphodiesterase [Myxococcota bacterium]|jgi:glycerophosphoryl diester phosphodiesterase